MLSSAIMATHPDMARDVLKNNETIVKVAARKSIFSGLGKNSLIFADDEVARFGKFTFFIRII